MQYSYWQGLIVSFIIVSFQQWFTVPFQSDLRIDIQIFLVSQGELWAGTIRGCKYCVNQNILEQNSGQIFWNDILMKTTFRFAQLFTRTGYRGPSTPSDFLSPISFFLSRSAHNIFFWLLIVSHLNDDTVETMTWRMPSSQILVVTNGSICRSVWSNSFTLRRQSQNIPIIRLTGLLPRTFLSNPVCVLLKHGSGVFFFYCIM